MPCIFMTLGPRPMRSVEFRKQACFHCVGASCGDNRVVLAWNSCGALFTTLARLSNEAHPAPP